MSITPFSSISFCFIYFATHLFRAYTFSIAMTPWQIETFIIIIMYCHSLFLVIFFAMKSTLSDINIVITGSFWLMFAWCIFSHSFTFSLPIRLYFNQVFWRQHILRLCFLIHFVNLYLLIGIFWPFTFNVIIGMLELVCHFIICFLMVVCFLFLCVLSLAFLYFLLNVLEFYFDLPIVFWSMSLFIDLKWSF